MSLRPQDEIESPRASNRLSSANVFVLIAISSVLSVTGIEMRSALKKIAAHENKSAAVATTETKKLLLKDAFRFMPITTENGEIVQFRFLDDGFSLQIDNRFFQLKSIDMGFFELSAGDIRFNIGKERITQMGYDDNDTLVIVVQKNLLRVPPEAVQKIVTHLHECSKDCDVDTVPAVNMQLDLDDENPLKAVMPSKGSMPVAFWHMKESQKSGNLTALSK